MFSSGEMEVLSAVSLGCGSIRQISEKTGKSIPQIYKIVGSLQKADTVRFSNGVVVPVRKTHVTLLLDILRNSYQAVVSLSGCGLDILSEMREPKRVAEISLSLGLHQTTVSRKIRQLETIGMIKKDDGQYMINNKLWPDLRQTVESYVDYYRINDVRAPPGSKIYHSSKDMVIFADESGQCSSKTAFSKYDEYGIKFYPGTYFCVIPPADVTLQTVFTHSLYIAAASKEWRLKMMALILYAKFRDELSEVEHPLKDEMDRILKGERIEGWVKLDEMQERADIYGVVLK